MVSNAKCIPLILPLKTPRGGRGREKYQIETRVYVCLARGVSRGRLLRLMPCRVMTKQLFVGSSITVVGQDSGFDGGGTTLEKVQSIRFELTLHCGFEGLKVAVSVIGCG